MIIDISIRALSHRNASHIEQSAGTSFFWEMPHDDTAEVPEFDKAFEKQLWIQRVLMKWGICGYTAFVSPSNSDRLSTPPPAATVIFAPANYLPGANTLPSGPVSPDAILITNVYVAPPYMGLYLEHQLIDTVVEEARRRGIKAVEAFARVEDLDDNIATDIPEAYRGWESSVDNSVTGGSEERLDNAPMLSEDILEEQNFSIVQQHPRFPRYRKEINTYGGLFSQVQDDAHEHVNGERELGTVIGGDRLRRPQYTFLQADMRHPFLSQKDD